jgi:peptide/nickel transport system permease protein
MPGPSSKTTLYISNKAFRYAITIFIILTLNFFIPRMMPGDPMTNLLGEGARRMDRQYLEELRAEYGLDRPLHEQYLSYLSGLVRLDLGYSIHKSLKVKDLLMERIFWTFLLVFPSIIIGGVAALILGSIAGFKEGSMADHLMTSGLLILYSSPTFLFAMIMVSIFSFHLGWFPLGSFASGKMQGASYFLDVAWHLFLPVIILALFEAAYTFLVIRKSVSQILGEYFIFVAKAKGLSDRVIELHHVLRNVLPQFISIMALNLGFMVSGALIIEIVFSLNGMGTLIYDAVISRDYPVMQGAFLVLTFFLIAANFFADLLYGIADPRIADAKDSV